MAEFTVVIDTKELEKDLTAIGQSIIPKAGASAINKTLSHARTLSVRSVAKATGSTQSKIRPYLEIDKATPSKLFGLLTASGKHIPLAEFPSRQLKKGVKAKAWGKWKIYPGTFYATVGAGHFGIFHRFGKSPRAKPKPRKRWRRTKTGRRRANQTAMVRPYLPIEELWGPSVPVEFQRFINDSLKQAITTKLKKNYAHELKWRIEKLEGRGSGK